MSSSEADRTTNKTRAAPERNLLENGDFHRAAGTENPRWQPLNAPILAENDQDFVTEGRSYDVVGWILPS